jgi:hypothetical protein
MKIILTPTNNKDYPAVSVEVSKDDLNIVDIFDDLIIPALLGAGYQRETIDNYLDNKY